MAAYQAPDAALLKEINDYYASPMYLFGQTPFQKNGIVYQQNGFSGSGEDQKGAIDPWRLNVYDINQSQTDDLYSKYGFNGQYQGDGQFKEVDHNGLLATGILTAVSMGAYGAYAAANAASQAGAAGATMGGAGLAGAAEGGLGNGAFLGEGAWTPTAGGGGMPGGFGGGAGGWTSAAADSQLANLGIEAAGGNPLAGYVGTGGVTGSPIAGGTSWLSGLGGGNSTLTNQIIKSGLGAALGGGGGGAGGGGGSGGGGSATEQSRLDPRLDAPVFGDLVPRTQQMLGQQMPGAQALGANLSSVGGGLLNRSVAGNGVGQVTLDAPTTATNPYLTGMADDMQRRTSELLGKNNLAIQGNAVSAGGLGGSRQGVAQGSAAAGAADSLQGQLAGLYGNAYNQDQNRALQKYGQDQNFWSAQRAQDIGTVGLGADLSSAGQQAPWAPLKNAAGLYAPFSGYGTRTSTAQEGEDDDWQKWVSTGLGVYGAGSNAGWW